MIDRLKISKRASDKIIALQGSTNLTRNILVRLAIGLSLRDESQPEPRNHLTAGGLEINRAILTGDYDFIYKSLMIQHAGRELTDEEYFPKLFNDHLERGIDLLEAEYQHAGNYERFAVNLLKIVEE